MKLDKRSDFEPTTPWTAPAAVVAPWGQAGSDPRIDADEQTLAEASHNAFPIVATKRSSRDSLGMAVGAAIALVLGCLTFVSMNVRRDAESEPESASLKPTEQPGYASGLEGQVSSVPRPASEALAPIAPMTEPQMQALNQPLTSTPALSSAPTVRMPHAAPAMVFDGSAMGTQSVEGGTVSSPATAGMLAGAANVQGLTVTDSAAARSSRIEDPANTVVQGTLIPAVLETAVNSDLPGFARAVVSEDVRSFDESRVLVPRSSRLIGEYKTGLTAGQKRVFLVWTRLVRPDGVSIALASPSVGFSGEAGVGGKVNHHFLERFGSAILMSVIGGASTALSGGATVIVAGGQNAASAAVQGNGQRSPTVRVRQGEPIRVFTARDLIFTSGGEAAE